MDVEQQVLAEKGCIFGWDWMYDMRRTRLTTAHGKAEISIPKFGDLGSDSSDRRC